MSGQLRQARLTGGALLALCLLLSLLLPLVSPAASADSAEEKRAQIKQLNQQMQQLQTLLKSFRSDRSEVQNALRKAEVDIGQLQKKIADIQTLLNVQQRELKKLQAKRAELKDSLKVQQQQIGQQVIAAYQLGQQKKLKVLLNQEEPEKLSRSLTYYDYFNQARSEQIDNYLATIQQLDEIEPQIQEKALTLSQAKQSLNTQFKALRASQSKRKKSLAKINAAIKNEGQRLKKINRDRQELERLLDAMEQAITNINIPSDYRPFKQLKGKLPWPLKGKAKNRFGGRRADGKLRWDGLIIPASEGSQIKAIHHGRIVFADWLRGFGLLVIVDHGDGYMSLYAHNQSILRETGEWVTAGDIIATAGKSGGQQQSGLYFEIRHNGKPTDPKRWCRRG